MNDINTNELLALVVSFKRQQTTKAFGSWRLPLTLPLQKWKRNLRKVVLIQKRLLRLRRVFVSSSCKENVGLVTGVEMCMKEAPQLH